MTGVGPALPAALQCHPEGRQILRCAQNDRAGALLTKRTPKLLGSFCEIASQPRHHLAGEALDLLHPLGPAGDHELEGEVVDADLAVHIEGLEELLGIAAQLALVLGNGVSRHLDWAAAGQPYLLWVASCFSGQA